MHMHRDTYTTGHPLVASSKIGTENINMKKIGSLPVRALWLHFEDRMDYR